MLHRGMFVRLLFFFAVFMVIAGGTPAAQATRLPLADVKSLRCVFKLMATGTWTPAGESAGEVKAGSLSIAYSDIDTQEGTAEVAGVTGAPHIVAQLSGGYLHLIQIGGTGYLYTTTVFDKVSRAGWLKAVHSRHEYTEVSLPGFTSRPQQYYGECEMRSVN